MGRRQENAEATRRRLLETGGALIARLGFDQVSVEAITQACGVAKGTFYVHFPSKEALAEAVGRQPFADLEAETEALGGPVEARLRHYARGFLGVIRRFGLHLTQQWVRGVIDPARVRPGLDAAKRAYDLETFERLLRGAVARGELRPETPTGALARLIVAQLYGTMVCWCMAGGALDTDALLEDWFAWQLGPTLARFAAGPQAGPRVD